MSLPQPEPLALAHSNQLQALIRDEIVQSGPISFARFMQRALYEPGFGYYMSGQKKFGARGDFVTAPEVSALYSQCLARQCAEILQQIGQASILEFGAGTGVMSAEILRYLHQQNSCPDRYYIMELSAELKDRQRRTLQQRVPELLPRVEWLESLQPLKLSGVILANEVLDAMPVERFIKRDSSVYCLLVDWDKSTHSFTLKEEAASEDLMLAVTELEEAVGQSLPEGYSSEINLQLKAWFNSLSVCLEEGMALIVDYGYARSDYYHIERNAGTLMCHYQHRAHDDALRWAGLQDITAHVDFSAVAEAASQAGMNVLGYTDQLRFLMDCGIESLLAEAMQSADTATQIQLTQQAKTLMMPGQMGEQFKVMALASQYNQSLCGFSEANDLRHYL